MKRLRIIDISLWLLLSTILFSQTVLADGGMYPITKVKKSNIKKRGLKIDPDKIYDSTGKISLIHGVVQIGGCTGSFVSKSGIILTNHHCAFSTLQPYSSPDNNLLEQGYLAETKEKELKTNLVVKIMIYNRDVSADVLKGIAKTANASDKKLQIANNMELIRREEQSNAPEQFVEVNEMLLGKSYIVFRYKILRDIRVVYIPARNIGEFGGESDNWVWPRHNADFSFLRAYVGKNGDGASYNEQNIPYVPAQVMDINASGLKKDDFVMIWGYPGRTYRNYPASFVGQHERNLLPFVSELYEWQINKIKELGAKDPVWEIRQQSKMKSLANVEKNYKGKIKVLNAIGLVEQRQIEENYVIDKLRSRNIPVDEYYNALLQTNRLYAEMEKTTLKYLWYGQLLRESPLTKMAHIIDDYNGKLKYTKKLSLDSLASATLKEIKPLYRGLYIKYDTAYLHKMLMIAANFKGENRVLELAGLESKAYRNFNYYFSKSKFLDSNYVYALVTKKKALLVADPFIITTAGIYNGYRQTDNTQNTYRTQVEALLPNYIDGLIEARGDEFLPDANSTMRISFGNIKGFSPSDGVLSLPTTTLAGMIEKDNLSADYIVNKKIKDVAETKANSRFGNQKDALANLCVLYNTDTSGGNSGSPVLNDMGELVGLNFDRAFEATVNDYAWNEKYSRSIGVDIRFVLWTTLHVGNAENLIKELNIVKE
ncbi:MAG: S46 family peptidase [Bacteroidota bacterium]|nr:S46 family peptidase [Bacteroidota bacterium]